MPFLRTVSELSSNRKSKGNEMCGVEEIPEEKDGGVNKKSGDLRNPRKAIVPDNQSDNHCKKPLTV